MSKPDIQLIVYDLDGTMLNHKSEISQNNLAALAEARAKGITLMPATGRPLASLTGTILDVPGVRYVLTSNGAAIWDLGATPEAAVHSRCGKAQGTPAGQLPDDTHCLALSPLPSAAAIQVVEALRPFGPGALKVFVHGRMIYEQPSVDWELTCGRFRLSAERATVVPNLPDYIAAHKGQVEKVCMFFASDEKLQGARKVLDQLPGIEVVQGAPDNLEITAPGVDKGSGLHKACAVLGIHPGQVLAMGDSENDLAMLQEAGFAGVVANGIPQAKALADYISVADNDHDAAAEIIHHYI